MKTRQILHLDSFGHLAQTFISAGIILAVLYFVAGAGESWNEFLKYSSVIIAFLCILPVVFLWHLFELDRWFERHISMLMIFFGVLVAIGGIGIAVTTFYQGSLSKDEPRGPLIPFKENPEITWDFQGKKPNVSFLGMTGPGAQSLVYSFQAQGTNNTERPIKGISGSIQSDRTLKELPVEFDFSGANGIQKKGHFYARAFFSPDKQGVSFDEFAKEWGSFTFTYTYNGRAFSIPINETAVRKMISRMVFGEAFFEKK